MTSLLSLVLLSVCSATVVVENPWDQSLEPDLGYYCANYENRGLKYYVDDGRQRFYPYYYRGCPTESNEPRARVQMLDRSELSYTYLWQDYIECPGFVAPTGHCNSNRSPVGYGIPEIKCPAGSTCQGFSVMSIYANCCDDDYAARYQHNQAAHCPENSTAIPDFFGRRCSHDFCPNDTICMDGDFEAYCCAPN